MRQVDTSQVEEQILTLQGSALFTDVFKLLLRGDSLEPT